MKRVLITGANRGIGLGFVEAYLEKGYSVVATCRHPDAAAALSILQDTEGHQLSVERLDVAEEASIRALAERLDGVFELVIANAGVLEDEPFGDWTFGAFERTLKTNSIGPAILIQAMAKKIEKGGKVVQLSSGMGSIRLNMYPELGYDSYAMSKAALNVLGRRLAAKLGGRGICVASISPGWVQTEMGGAEADLTVRESVERMIVTIEQLTIEGSGNFIGNEGSKLPW